MSANEKSDKHWLEVWADAAEVEAAEPKNQKYQKSFWLSIDPAREEARRMKSDGGVT